MSLKALLKSSLLGDVTVRRPPFIYRRYRRFLAAADETTFEERRGLRDRLTARTLSIASETTYARERGSAGEYDRWPVIAKDTLRAGGVGLSRRVLLPANRAETGGSTGVPISLLRSWQSVVFEQAVHDHLVRRHGGIEWKGARIAVLRGDTVKPLSDLTPPFWKRQHNGRVLALSAHHLNVATVPAYLEALREFQPQVLWVYPSALEVLVRIADPAALRIHALKIVFSSSEVLKPETARQGADCFGVPVLDYYGQAERVALSYGLDGGEHRFLAAYGRVELRRVREEEGETLYEVIGTSYWNKAQPLVRFATGDLARLPRGLDAREVEEVSLGVRPFFGIAGREGEYLVGPDGARLIGINHLPRGVPDVLQMQVDQIAPDQVQISVIPLPGFSEVTRELILEKAHQKIPRSMKVDVVAVTSLQRTMHGKVPLVRRSFEQ